MAEIVRVVTELALQRSFDYGVPAMLSGRVQVGHRVRVPFGSRSAVGYVIEVVQGEAAQQIIESSGHMLKSVAELLDPGPLIRPQLIELARWMAEYYVCAVETSLRAVLPEAVRREEARFRKQLAARLLKVPEVAELEKMTGRKEGQRRVLEALMQESPQDGTRLQATCKVSSSVLQTLQKQGWIELAPELKERDPYLGSEVVPSTPIELNEEQRVAFARVCEEMEAAEPKPLLLHGVTGSGKTEIYLQAIARVLEQGRGAIVLVPEIALTPQSVERFRARFTHLGVEVAVLHSGLTAGERHDQWHKIRSGRARLVIGARSAIFAPVEPLGIIVVDEEHEASYKQQEAPRYHARDVAVVRGRMERVPVLLGSATPALESWFNAQKSKYILLTLKNRVDFQQMPTLHVVDMRYETMRSKGAVVLSRKLYEAVYKRIEKGEQSILFLNRRGYATSVLCEKCGNVMQCNNCSVPVTLHRREGRVRCHLCGFSEVAPKECPACHDPGIKFTGAGTERVETAIENLFPKARVRRMDSDTMRKRGDYEAVLGEFRAGKIDILVGTQMIAKGLHFPNVTLVGIIHADLALHLPDFRASERIFQLIVQVAGRAGRGDLAGEVFVQSYTPFHAAIQFARHHDYEGFSAQELELREQYGYPPYQRAALISLRAKDEDSVRFVAEAIAKRLKEQVGKVAEISGPAPAPIARVENWFRYQLFIKMQRHPPVAAALREIVFEKGWPGGVELTVDVDCVGVL